MTDDTTRKPLGQIANAAHWNDGYVSGNVDWDAVAAAVELVVLQRIKSSGHKIVPVEPTREMLANTGIEDSEYYFCDMGSALAFMAGRYADMLEAAPEYAP